MAKQVFTFGPFNRSVSVVEPHLAPPETLAAGSVNYLIDPISGGAFKRSGCAIAGGDTANASTKRATNGIMESAPEWVPARLRPFKSAALADGASGGYPTYSVLFRKEPSSTSWPTVDDGHFGTDYVRRASTNYNLLKEFGVNCWPTGGGAHGAAIQYRVVPFWYESGEGGYSRGAFEFARRFATAGSWGSLDAGRWRYYPNLRAMPMRWDGGCNNDSSTITNAVRYYPTGPFSPPWMPTATETSSGTASTQRQWKEGTAFYYSVMYQWEDGSYSMPVIPRPGNATLTGGYGYKVLGTPGGTNYYRSVDYTGIPIGPSGVVARVLLRSPKQVLAAATDVLTIDPSDLRILGVLRNNTQTTFSDTLADDDGLLEADEIVRFDGICPPRARHIGTGDSRVIVGYTLQNPGAIHLYLMGVATNFDQNLAETATGTSGATSGVWRVTETTLECGLANAGTIASIVTYTLSSYTIQDLVDAINATAISANVGAWRAQVVPGADPNAPASSLCPTVWVTSSSATLQGTTALAMDATRGAAVPIGYKIHDTGGAIPAGTYIVSKDSTTQCVMSANAVSSSSAAALYIYADCGDTACTASLAVASRFGWVRAFGGWLPSVVYFRRTSMVGYDQPATNRTYFTTSSPGAAATGVSLAANAYIASNRRDAAENSGQVMGIVDIQGAAVIAYAKRINLFVNERGSNTGEDFDYRLQTVNATRGCASPWSLVAAAGCAVYLTNIGLVATDKSKREILLSSDEYQPARGKGNFAYEVPLCVAAAAADSPDCWFSGALWGNRLVYSYRTDSYPYAFSVYDFSPGADSIGLDALADPEQRRPYGWSSICFLDSDNLEFGPRAMGAVEASDGLRLYGALNDNYGTNDGRVDQLFTGATDNGVNVYATLQTRTLLPQPNQRFSHQTVTVVHKVNYSGVTAAPLRTLGGGGTYALTSSGSNDFQRDRFQLNQSDRSPGVLASVQISDMTASVGGVIWTMELETDVLRLIGAGT